MNNPSMSAVPNRMLVLVGGLTAMMLAMLSSTIVSTAMPRIATELNDLAHLSWIFTAYMLTSTVTVPVIGKLSDIFGRRVIYLAAIAGFVAASAAAGFSQTMFQLILCRAVQGVAGGALMVNTAAMIGDIFPPAERGKWQGVTGAVFGLASGAGPLLRGWITDALSWHWVFWVNVPFGILAFGVILGTLPKLPPRATKPTIDYAGAALLALGLTPLLLSMVWGGSTYPWGSSIIWSLIAVGVVAIALFPWTESRAKEPVLPLDLFRNRVFTISSGVTMLSSMGMFGVLPFIPLYAQVVVGFSATNSGLVLTPMMVGVVLASAIVGQVVSRTGKYRVMAILGMSVATLGMFLFTRVSIDTGASQLVTAMFVTGLGLGATMPIFGVVVQNAFDHSRLGVVTASTQLFRTIGGTVGSALFGGILNARIADGLAPLANDPFLQRLSALLPGAARGPLNANAIQGVLGTRGQEALSAAIARLPADMQAQVVPQMQHFLMEVKIVINDAIGFVFVGGAVLMALATIVTVFLPQLALQKTNRRPAEEAGMELEAELGQLDAAREPDLTGKWPAGARLR